jgi:hypothetical protein
MLLQSFPAEERRIISVIKYFMMYKGPFYNQHSSLFVRKSIKIPTGLFLI